MMAPTGDRFFRCSYRSLDLRCFRRVDHLSQVSSRTYYDDLWVAPIGRLQARPACRMRGLGSTPVPLSFVLYAEQHVPMPTKRASYLILTAGPSWPALPSPCETQLPLK